ncbi:MAG: hypothetical protein IE938_19220 [Pseudomonas balearica]|nr:hypothetical protein [Stutzerimonas balearica]
MFTFEENYTFEWPVTVKYPSAGGDVEATFTGVFKLPQDEIAIYEAPIDEAGNLKITSMAQMISEVRARLAEYWIGWGEDLQSPDGKPIPYSDEMRDRLLKIKQIREGVDRALSEGAMGIREKN